MPELWSSMSPRKLEELAMMLVPSDADYLDWRHFLTLASLPWPKTTQASLLDTLRRFREVDSQGHGNLSQHDYMKVLFVDRENSFLQCNFSCRCTCGIFQCLTIVACLTIQANR